MDSDTRNGSPGLTHRRENNGNTSPHPPLTPTEAEPPPNTTTPTAFVTMEVAEPEAAAQAKSKKTFREMTLREKTRYVSSCITVEPLVICYMVPGILSSITTQNLNLEKACRVNLAYNDTVCSAIAGRDSGNYTHETEAVSTLVAEMNVWMTALRSAGPAILVLFVGSWSDRRHRRKPIALSPIIGDLCSTVGLLLCSIFLLQWPLEVAGIIEAIFPALSGGLPFLFIACYAYIGEVTTEEDRTFRIGMFAFFATLAAPIATAISGYVHESLGYLGVYSLVTVLYIIAVAYCAVRFKEPTPPVPRPAGVSFLRDFFDWHHVRNTVTVALRDGPNRRRLRVILLVSLYITIEGPVYGEYANLFLFTFNRYHWTSTEFALYSTYEIVVGIIGNALVTLLLVRLMKLRDSYVGIVGIVSKIISVPVFAFGYLTWHMYAAKAISILSAAAVISMRSLATKMVPPHELGQLMGFLAIVEAIIPVAFSPVYNKVFASTLSTFPGAFYLLTAAVSAIALLSFLTIEKFQGAANKEEERQKKQEKDGDSRGVTNLAFIDPGTEKTQNTYL